METDKNLSGNSSSKKAFSELSEEEKKLWEVDEDLLSEKDEPEDGSNVRVMGAPIVSSTGFVRPYNPLRRPKVSYKNFILAIVIFALGLSAVIFLSSLYLKPYSALLITAYTVIFILSVGKKAVIWLVHLYQSKASDDTRLRCRFEPSCSEYMIKSVNKYGFIKGSLKGIGRVLRCRAPNGGIDYP